MTTRTPRLALLRPLAGPLALAAALVTAQPGRAAAESLPRCDGADAVVCEVERAAAHFFEAGEPAAAPAAAATPAWAWDDSFDLAPGAPAEEAAPAWAWDDSFDLHRAADPADEVVVARR